MTTTTTTATTTTTITAHRLEARSNDEGLGRLPGCHHEPALTSTAASNCSWGGWEPGNERRADDGYDMDMTRTTGSARTGENELQGERTNRGNEQGERGNGEGPAGENDGGPERRYPIVWVPGFPPPYRRRGDDSGDRRMKDEGSGNEGRGDVDADVSCKFFPSFSCN